VRTPWLLLILVAAAVGGHAQTPGEPRLRIVSPTDDTYLSGPVLLRALIDPPVEARRVSLVTFFADGDVVCRVDRSPFECGWDAGPRVAAHQIRATAVFADGRRLAASVRTRALEYAEAVDVPLVQVTAVVTDADGRFVDGLPRDAFRVFDEDQLQKITYFATEDAPLDIVATIDVSGSMTRAMPQVKSAVKAFVSALAPEVHATLVGFNDNVFVLSRRAAPGPSMLVAVDRLAPWGGTALYDAVIRSLDLVARQQGRKAVVLFTDGDDQSSFTTSTVAEQRVEAADAVIFTIAQGRATSTERLQQTLGRLAEVSGGRSFVTDDLQALATAFQEISTELSHQYLLGYVPTHGKSDGSWRRIRVELAEKRMRVRARRGYRAGGVIREGSE
jgi:VWFA-related protein